MWAASRDGVGIRGADGQRLFHHHGDSVPGADFHHSAVIEGVGVCQDGLGMGFPQHFSEIGKKQTAVKAKLLCVTRRNLLVRLGDSDNLDVRTM